MKNTSAKIMSTILCLLILFGAVGCTQYVYQGTITAQDSLGEDRDFLVWWTATERRFWFDAVQGSIRLKTECSNNTVNYDEQDAGIIFELRPGFDETALGDAIGPGGACGEILDAGQIQELREGTLRLTIRCKAMVDEFAVGSQVYLTAREEPYLFEITRTKADAYGDGAPNLDCDEVSR